MLLLLFPILVASTLALCANAPAVTALFSFVERFEYGMHTAEVKSIDGENTVEIKQGAGLLSLTYKRREREMVTVYIDELTNKIDHIVLVEDVNAKPVITRFINAKGEITSTVEIPDGGHSKLSTPKNGSEIPDGR